MEQPKAHCQCQKEQRQKTGFHIALFHRRVSVGSDIALEKANFIFLLSGGFDCLDPINCFSQTAVHHTKAAAYFACDWLEFFEIQKNGERVSENEQERCKQQRWIDFPADYQGDE